MYCVILVFFHFNCIFLILLSFFLLPSQVPKPVHANRTNSTPNAPERRTASPFPDHPGQLRGQGGETYCNELILQLEPSSKAEDGAITIPRLSPLLRPGSLDEHGRMIPATLGNEAWGCQAGAGERWPATTWDTLRYFPGCSQPCPGLKGR